MADAIQIVVEGFRALRRAEIELDPLALVCGPNEAGKTSVAQAVAAALTGNAFPLLTMRDGRPRPALTKGDAPALVRRGAEAGSAKGATERGEARVSWPECVVTTDGRPPGASILAAGLASFADIHPDERAQTLIDLLKATPDRDDLAAALDLSQDKLERLWSTIESLGWDGAHERARERGAQMKGQWREITGEAWGAKKAAQWKPAGWSDDLAERSVDLLRAEVVAANAALDAAYGEQAVSEAQAMRNRELAGQADATKAEADAARAAAEQARAELDAAIKARAQAIEIVGDSGLPCPWCGKNVRVGRGASGEMRLQRFELTMDRDEHGRLHREIVALDKRLAAARDADFAAGERHARATQRAEICREAARKVASFATDAARAKAVAEARAVLDQAEARESAASLWRRAQAIEADIETNAKVVAVLAPSGLRQSKLTEALDGFNARLAALAAAADWPAPSVDQDMIIRRDPEPYALLSRSAQYRVNVVLQAAIAERDESDLLVIDGFDILDAPGRDGLFALLDELGKPALATATYSNPRLVPDLEKAGMGRSYWLREAVAVPLAMAGEEVGA